MQRKLNRIMLAATLSALFGSFGLSAQDRMETAEIPFDYHANTKVLPAGNYRIEETSTMGLFRISDGRGHGLFVSAPTPQDGKAGKGHLAFLHSGNDYVLSQIWMPGNSVGQVIPDSTLERQLTRKIGVASLVTVALHNR